MPMKRRANKICEQCGREYYPGSARRRFCDLRCASLSNGARRKTELQWNECKECGKEYQREAYEARRGRHLYCSRGCRSLGRRRGTIRKCQKCGCPFYARLSDTQKGKALFCSRKCHKESVCNWGPTSRIWTNNSGYEHLSWKRHPLANRLGTVPIHRLVFWQESGYSGRVLRLLKGGATVHHKNGVRNDNRPENLEVRLSGKHRKGISLDDAIALLVAHGYQVQAPLLGPSGVRPESMDESPLH